MQRMKSVALLAIVLLPLCAWSQKYDVKVIDRQTHDTAYSYVVPGTSYSQSTASVNCVPIGNGANCAGTSSTVGHNTPGHQESFTVTGATLALQIPDGRVAIVNCESKFAEHFGGVRGNKRSCRFPLVDTISAEFKGDKAKLEWTVSLDGQKKQSETYKIIAVLDKP